MTSLTIEEPTNNDKTLKQEEVTASLAELNYTVVDKETRKIRNILDQICIGKKKNELVKLTTNDGSVQIPYYIAEYSFLIKSILDRNDEEDEEDKDDEIPLTEVTYPILCKILYFLKKYSEEPFDQIEKPLRSENLKEIVSDEWYADFIERLSQEELFAIIQAANYMDIKPLLDLSCASVAAMIKGKTPEEIRVAFNIDDDFTDDEKETMNIKE
jgi:S-phase kinase-associated protein 1